MLQGGGELDKAPRITPEDPARAGESSGPADTGVRDGEDDLCAFNWENLSFPAKQHTR